MVWAALALFACSDAELETEVTRLRAENAALEAALTSCESGAERDTRREELQRQFKERAKQRAEEAPEGAITRDGETYLVRVERIPGFEDWGARAVQHRAEDGSYDGYRLTGVRPKGVADQLGLANGDIIHEVNGIALVSPEAAADVAAAIESADTVVIKRTSRQGESLTYRLLREP